MAAAAAGAGASASATAPTSSATAAAATAPEATPNYLPRQRRAPVESTQAKEVGLQVLSYIVKAVDYTASAELETPLRLLSTALASVPVNAMFPEWSPPMAAPEAPVKIDSAGVSADNSESSSYSASNVLTESKQSFWRGSVSQKTTKFEVRLAEAAQVSTLRITWAGAPAKYTVELRGADAAGQSSADDEGTWTALGEFSPSSSAVTHTIPVRQTVSGVRLLNTDFAAGAAGRSSSNQHSISRLELLAEAGGDGASGGTAAVTQSMGETLSDIGSFLVNAVGKASGNARALAIQGMMSHVRASGSLLALLRLVDACLEHIGDAAIPDSVRPFAHQFLVDLSVEAAEEIEAGMGGGGRVGEVKARFDPACKSSGMEIQEDGTKVRSSSGSNQYCYVDTGFTKGKAAWEFMATRDSRSDECAVYGCGIKPVDSGDYNSSRNLWMIRGYNGCVYHAGSQVRTVRKIHENELVRFELDCDTHEVTCSINGEDQGVVFTNVTGEVFPAVCTYSSSREVKLVKVEYAGNSMGEGDAPVAEFDSEHVERTGQATGVKGGHLDTDETAVSVGGISDPMAVALVPDADPSEDTAVKLELEAGDDGEAKYETFVAHVAVDDSSPPDARAAEVEVLGDDEVLWRSGPLQKPGSRRFLRVFLRGAGSLTLRSRVAAGAGASGPVAAAVLMGPRLCPARDWSWTGVDPLKGDPSPSEESAATGTALATSLLESASRFASVQARLSTPPAPGLVAIEASMEDLVSLEAPFAIEACADTFTALKTTLGRVMPHARKEGPDGGPYTTMAVALLRLVRTNLLRLAASNTDPQEVGITLVARDGAGAAQPTLRPLHDVLQTIIAPDSGFPTAMQMAGAEAVDAGLSLLYPTAAERRELLTSLIKQGGVIEVQFRFPAEKQLSPEEAKAAKAKEKDGGKVEKQYDLRFERALLLLQVECEALGWPSSLDGKWGAYTHLVIKIPDADDSGGKGASNTAVDFLDVGFGIVMRKAGFDSWTFPTGCDSPNVTLKIERYLNAGESARVFTSAESGGFVRIYPRSAGTYDDVCALVNKFLDKVKVTSEDDSE